MDTGLFKLALTSQTIFGAVQFLVVFFVFGGVLGALQFYHANDRLTFSCSPKPDDFFKQLCYDKYTSTMSPWLIPRNFVAIIFVVLCVCWICWICFLLYSAMTIRQIKRDQEAQRDQRQAQWRKLHCIYDIHVVKHWRFLEFYYRELGYELEMSMSDRMVMGDLAFGDFYVVILDW